MIKTLLRYPGGKSRAANQILKYIPKDTNEIFSPFLGGGAVEIALNNMGIAVYGYDIFNPLVTFWQQVIASPNELSEKISSYYPLKKENFYELQKTIENYKNDKITYAAIFYVLNRCSFSGSTLSGGMSPSHPRFTMVGIQKVKNSKFSNFNVERMDFHDSLKKYKNIFAYVDPPYMIKNNLYGVKGNLHKDFDHKGLYEMLKSRNNWLLSYNDCSEIREMYKNYEIKTLTWKYGMSKEKVSNEILIINSLEG